MPTNCAAYENEPESTEREGSFNIDDFMFNSMGIMKNIFIGKGFPI